MGRHLVDLRQKLLLAVEDLLVLFLLLVQLREEAGGGVLLSVGLREIEAAVLHALIQKNIRHKNRRQTLAQNQGCLHRLAQLHTEDDALSGEEHHAADTAQPHQRPGQK